MRCGIATKAFPGAVFSLLWLTCCSDGTETHGTARLRLLHASPDTPALSLIVDRASRVTNLKYGARSGYSVMQPGLRDLLLQDTSAGKKTLLATGINAAARDYTLFAVDSAATLQALIVTEDRGSVADKARLRFVHVIPDAPTLDLRVGGFDGPVLLEKVSYKSASATISVPAAGIELAVLKTPKEGQQPLASDLLGVFSPFGFTAGTVYTLVALGTISTTDSVDLVFRLFDDLDATQPATDLVPEPIP